MMNERQHKFREEYRANIAGWYNGWLHVAVIYAIGFAGLYYFTRNISDVQWWEWLTIPVVAFICNVFEWFLHQHVMHRPLKPKLLRGIYGRHTLTHHQFFTDEEITFDGTRDWRVTFFPPYALIVFMIMSIPAALIMGYLISSNVGWLVMCSTTGMYLVYEFFHFCCHVHDNWFVRYTPFINTIRRHHIAHHNQHIMMQRNMNLTFPVADWLFGTSDLNRGCLGHVFNGYSTKYVKSREEMRQKPRPSRARRRSAVVGA